MESCPSLSGNGARGLRSAFIDGLGEAADDQQLGSEFLKRLSAQSRAEDVRYHIGIGKRSFVSAADRDAILKDFRRIVTHRDVPAAPRQRMVDLLSAPELTLLAAPIIRKNSYCNRSERGADTQAVLMSIYRTLKQRGQDPIQTIANAIATYLNTGQLPPLPPKNTTNG